MDLATAAESHRVNKLVRTGGEHNFSEVPVVCVGARVAEGSCPSFRLAFLNIAGGFPVGSVAPLQSVPL
jgi:hypothetical protein